MTALSKRLNAAATLTSSGFWSTCREDGGMMMNQVVEFNKVIRGGRDPKYQWQAVKS